MVDRHVYSGQSIQSAVNAALPGDNIIIHAGTYTEHITFGKAGTNNAWITLQPYQNDAVIVDGAPTGNYNGAFYFPNGSHYLRITGLEVKNSNYMNTTQTFAFFPYGTTASDVTNIRIDHCNIHHHQSSGIYAYHASNIWFDNNIVDYVHASNGSQEAISFSGVNGFDIHHNTLTRYGKEGIDCKSGTQNGFVHHNYVDSSNPPGQYGGAMHTCLYLDGFSVFLANIDVYNNYFTGDSGPGITMGPEQDSPHTNLSIFNNIVHIKSKAGDTQYRAFDCTTQTDNAHDWENIHIYNNTFYSEADSHVFRVIPKADNVNNLVIENNIIAGTNWTQLYFQLMPITVLDTGKVILRNNLFYRYSGNPPNNQWQSQSNPPGGFGTNPVLTDPLFINRTNGDFHLQPSSPAINQGTTVDLDFDYDDNPRPIGDYDIGAYEYFIYQPPGQIDDTETFTVQVQ